MNLEAIHGNYDTLNEAISSDRPFEKPTLFIRGIKSSYILPNDEPEIKNLFPSSGLTTMENAGHWVHADAPDEFTRIVLEFLEKQL
jgi:pimeloyl-ACP methyl ester carboxylesterase